LSHSPWVAQKRWNDSAIQALPSDRHETLCKPKMVTLVVINWPLAHLNGLDIEFSFHPAPMLCHHIRKNEFRLLGKHTMAHHPCFRTSRRTPVDAVPCAHCSHPQAYQVDAWPHRIPLQPHVRSPQLILTCIAAECVSSTSSTRDRNVAFCRQVDPSLRRAVSAFTRCAGTKRTRRMSNGSKLVGLVSNRNLQCTLPKSPQVHVLQRTGTGTGRSP
jgi:hypothetical protein